MTRPLLLSKFMSYFMVICYNMFMKKNVAISIVIPAYNEADRIINTINAFAIYLEKNYPDSEIIIIDDGSSDRTCAVVETFSSNKIPIRLLKNKINRGKGYAVKEGMLSANGENIFFSDADGSVPIEELPRFLKEISEGADVVIASRANDETRILKHQAFFRQTMGKTFNLFVRLLAFSGIPDTQCGFKCFRKEVAIELFSRSKIDGFAFDVEILQMALRMHYRIRQLGVTWINSKKSTVNPIYDSLKMLADLITIRFLHAND